MDLSVSYEREIYEQYICSSVCSLIWSCVVYTCDNACRRFSDDVRLIWPPSVIY